MLSPEESGSNPDPDEPEWTNAYSQISGYRSSVENITLDHVFNSRRAALYSTSSWGLTIGELEIYGYLYGMFNFK